MLLLLHGLLLALDRLLVQEYPVLLGHLPRLVGDAERLVVNVVLLKLERDLADKAHDHVRVPDLHVHVELARAPSLDRVAELERELPRVRLSVVPHLAHRHRNDVHHEHAEVLALGPAPGRPEGRLVLLDLRRDLLRLLR